MLKVLYGNYIENLRFERKADFLFVPLKTLYILFTLPFLLFALLMTIRSLGAFGNPLNEKFGIIKKILLHFAAIFWSFCGWIILLGVLEETLNFKVRLHLI